ncbi:NAD-dependent succinate-semialdehyde dehydrogenase [Chlorobium sp. BLA1]|uniref:NAD-dependent succinate-semialdehyde dehydrogenase n=1 Tax=Candidatus Chlorobium masyuteum TaxID=2716876 RepID=UPI0014209AF1|nr:NAD-dependent succinate-semialdehyde dehydrogenase [Candidatus Chlorobium masyuteum]NHQ60019.1 NAD-dependent succinate-semialdehyde dehydrogenase [Candidatus Chlorobium masyuteum]
MIITVNPSTEEPIAEYSVMTSARIEEVITSADREYRFWRKESLFRRSELMKRLATLLRVEKERHAAQISLEMGKPFSQAVAEVQKSALVCDYYAEHAESFLKPERSELDGGAKGVVKFEPIGLVLGIMPWNFPFWQVFRFAVPAIMAGNGVLLKHAPNVTGSAIAIEQLFRDAGFPEHLYRAVHTDLEDVDRLSGFMIDHPSVQGVSLTGSTAAGRAVAAKAGRALKRTVLELGGSDPYIVLDDADLNRAVSLCAASRLLNSGQSCISAKRFIVHSRVFSEFENLLLQRMQSSVTGDPFDPAVEVGPLARADLRLQLHQQVLRTLSGGARLLCGGELPSGRGFFYPPTLLSGVCKGMVTYSEETFGPVATLIEAHDDHEAVRIANDTPYGLGSAVFSASADRALAVADQLDAGNCFINSMVKSDPAMPFGGIKESGYGRELALYGIREFVNVKSFSVTGG